MSDESETVKESAKAAQEIAKATGTIVVLNPTAPARELRQK